MAHGVGSKAVAYVLATAMVIAAGFLWLSSSDTAIAYSGAQAEAQSDPYAFPNIDLCCKPKRPYVPYCVRNPHSPRCVCRRDPGHPMCQRDDADWPNGDEGWPNGGPRGGRHVTVDCGADPDTRARVFTSLQDAVDTVRPFTTIHVRGGFPGGDCREHVHIEKSLTIEGEGGSPAIVNGCLTITGPGRPTVRLRNLQVLGTTTGLNGSHCHRRSATYTGFDGRAHAHKINGDYAISALSVAGSTLYGDDLLIRSAEAALDAEHSVISLNGSTLAANPGANFSVRLERAEAIMKTVTVAGGKTGLYARMLDRHPMTFDNVQLQPARSQSGEPSSGRSGVVVSVIDEGLPALPVGGSAPFTWSGGTIQGFANGMVLESGVNAAVRRVRIVQPASGISIRAGATADIAENTIERVNGVGISVERGALGKAISNNVSRKRGDCFCVGNDCDDDDDDIESRHFTLRGNVCHREGWGW